MDATSLVPINISTLAIPSESEAVAAYPALVLEIVELAAGEVRLSVGAVLVGVLGVLVVPFCTLMEICVVPLAPALSQAVAFSMCVPFESVRVSSEQLYGES